MNWEVRTIGRGSYGSSVMHDTVIGDGDWGIIETKLRPALKEVCDMIAAHLSANADEAWSALVVSIRPDGGDVTLVPSAGAYGWNRSRVIYSYTVELEQLEREYHDLPDADDDPHGFDQAHDEMMDRAGDAVFRALAEPLRRLREVRPFELWRTDYDDSESLRPWK